MRIYGGIWWYLLWLMPYKLKILKSETDIKSSNHAINFYTFQRYVGVLSIFVVWYIP